MAATPISDEFPELAESVWIAQARAQREALQQQKNIQRELQEMQKNCIALLASINEALRKVEGK